MRLRGTIVSLALVALPVAAQQSESSPPILDVQLRASAPGAFGTKRIMFGSDEMIWPGTIKLAFDAITSADFLSPKHKRDILYHNAAKFLRFDPARMTVQ
jgi:hypothetical protein